MPEDNQATMEKYGITAEQKTEYTYKGHKYQKLDDAVRYAEIDQARATPDALPDH